MILGIDKEDIEEVIQHALEQYSSKYGSRYTYTRLVNGYRRFDPNRGMEYQLDLEFNDVKSDKLIMKRSSLIRPLSKVEIVPMPYVTENSRLNLVLPVTLQDREGVVNFLDNYAHVCLDSGDNVNLYVVFIYPTEEDLHNEGDQEDSFGALKAMISYYETKYMNGARISWLSVQQNDMDPLVVMDKVAKKLMDDSLVLMCSVNMDLSVEYLNRVRMNTINHWQAFFPISFWKYKPNLIYDEKPYPTRVEINKNNGHFDRNAYSQPSFYTGDYLTARSHMSVEGHGDEKIDLYELFLRYHDLHLFRAVEPALTHEYEATVCSSGNVTTHEAQEECLNNQAESMASKSQLAKLVHTHHETPAILPRDAQK